jgi:hypothetical protein
MKALIRRFFEAIGWSDRQWLVFWVVLAIVMLVPVGMMFFGWKLSSLNDVLIWLTGIVVLVYTIETQGLRFEMVRQNEMALKPFLVLFVKGNPWQRQLVLKNIGQGAALFVRIEDVLLGKVVGDLAAMRDRVVGGVATFTQYNYIESGEEAGVQALCATDPRAGRINLDFLPSIDPDKAQDNYEMTIHYQDVEGRPYQTHMRIGKDGVEIKKPDSWKSGGIVHDNARSFTA